MHKLTKFLQRDWRDRFWLAEALLHLVWARVIVSTIPFRRLAAGLGESQQESSSRIDAAPRLTAVKVSWAVQSVARHLPVGFVCLPQAIAAQRMLARRGIDTTLYIGASPGSAPVVPLNLHAWLRAGDKIVCGEREAAGHVVLLALLKRGRR